MSYSYFDKKTFSFDDNLYINSYDEDLEYESSTISDYDSDSDSESYDEQLLEYHLPVLLSAIPLRTILLLLGILMSEMQVVILCEDLATNYDGIYIHSSIFIIVDWAGDRRDFAWRTYIYGLFKN